MTDHEFLAMQNSTAVRPAKPPVPLRLLRPAFATLSALTPSLAARLAERLFLTPPRYPAPTRERDALARARRTIVQVAGSPVTTWTWGHGPIVLLVHGWGGRGAQLAGFVEPLVAHGCSVVAFDAPGHGVSPASQSSIVAFVETIRAIDRALGPIEGVIAHSIGAAAAARALYEGLGAQAAVFIAPPADLILQSHTLLESLGFGRTARELMQARIERRFGVTWAALDVRGYAPAMSTPLHIVHDRDDNEVPWQDGAIIAREWPAAALALTGGLGHRRILRDASVIRDVTTFVAAHVRPSVAGRRDAELMALPVA